MAVGPSATRSAMSTAVTTSATTSTTSSSASSSSSSSSSSGSGGAPSFSANGTAALILAFLAIGLFVGGMLAMIGLRRRALGRAQRWMMNEEPSPVWSPMGSDAEDDVRSRARRKKKKDVGTPPKLYDIYAPAKGIESAFWQDVLPLSAKSISHSTPHIRRSESEDIAQGGHRRWHFDALGFFHWPPGPTHPSPTPTRQTVQVAVVVAMPAPVDAEPLGLDFTLGLTQLSWNHDMAVLDTANVATLVDGRDLQPQ